MKSTGARSRACGAWPFEIDGEFGGVRPDASTYVDTEDWSGAKFAAEARLAPLSTESGP